MAVSAHCPPPPHAGPHAAPCPPALAHHPTPTPCAVHRLVCWYAWGPPPEGRPEACHFCCDVKECVNPRHLR